MSIIDRSRIMGDVEHMMARPRLAAWQRHEVATVAESLQAVQLDQTEKRPPAVSMCNDRLDAAIGGFRPEMVTVLGAPTSWGKTSWVIAIADECLRSGKRPLIVTGEDSARLYGARLAARRADLNALDLRNRDLSREDSQRLAGVAGDAEAVPWVLSAIGVPVETVARQIGELCAELGYDLVVVDYLQTMTCTAQLDRRGQLTHIAQTYAHAIKNAGASGCLVSQIRRLESGKRPGKHDLKESGDIENLAESILLGHIVTQGPRLRLTDGEVATQGEQAFERWITIAKNKDGPVPADAICLPWSDRSAAFT